MAYYLVRARISESDLPKLENELRRSAFVDMRPFGQALTKGLKGMRWLADKRVVWEEEDYCSPPLAMERDAVLDTYFTGIEVENVHEGEGWAKLSELPRVFPTLD